MRGGLWGGGGGGIAMQFTLRSGKFMQIRLSASLPIVEPLKNLQASPRDAGGPHRPGFLFSTLLRDCEECRQLDLCRNINAHAVHGKKSHVGIFQIPT
jgi:hypothetical protein